MLAAPLLALALLADPAFPVESFRLANGLTVHLSEDHSAPLVGVDVLYRVGSKDESPGHTGFAHLVRHIMSKGSAHLAKGEADRLIKAAGGISSFGIANDATAFWTGV